MDVEIAANIEKGVNGALDEDTECNCKMISAVPSIGAALKTQNPTHKRITNGDKWTERESSEQWSIRRRNETRIELKLKRNNFTLFYLCCCPVSRAPYLSAWRWANANHREKKNWEEIVKRHAARSNIHCVLLFFVCSLPHCAEEQSRVLKHMCATLDTQFSFTHCILPVSIIRNVAQSRCSFELANTTFQTNSLVQITIEHSFFKRFCF